MWHFLFRGVGQRRWNLWALLRTAAPGTSAGQWPPVGTCQVWENKARGCPLTFCCVLVSHGLFFASVLDPTQANKRGSDFKLWGLRSELRERLGG